MKQPLQCLLAAVACMLIAGGAQADAKEKTRCPVIAGQWVNVKEATAKHMYADYKGKRYYFCCVSCPEEFRKNPAKYAKR